MNTDKIKPAVLLLSTLLLFSSNNLISIQATRKSDSGNTGIHFDDPMEYKEKTQWYEENKSDELEEMMQRARSMKESGSWGLDGDEISMKGTTFGSAPKESKNYPTKIGNVTDGNARVESENFNPKYWRASGNGSEFLNQNLSQRQRIAIMSAIWADGKKPYVYGGAGRLNKNGTVSDCSGIVYQSLTGAGINVPVSSSGYPGSKLVTEVSLDDLEPGDVVWKSGHVELFLGKQGDKYCTMRAGIKDAGKPSHIDCRRNKAWLSRSFVRGYRPKGRDNPLTQKELEIMNGG